jgi:hypothetical protein
MTRPFDKNVLRVTTRGNLITTYINNTKFATVGAQVPEGDGLIGLHAESEMAHRNAWEFMDLKITDLPLNVGQNQTPVIKASALPIFGQNENLGGEAQTPEHTARLSHGG